MSKKNPSKVTKLFRDSLYYEILHTFGVPRYTDTGDIFLWEQVNFSRAAHARVLYDFFRKKRGKQEDNVIATDYGFSKTIGMSLRKRVNTQLMHLSYSRTTFTDTTKEWPSGILADLQSTVIKFMAHIESERPDLFVSPDAKQEWKLLREALQSGCEVLVWPEKEKYTLSKGRILPQGKAQFSVYTGREKRMACGSITNAADYTSGFPSFGGPPPQSGQLIRE